jgi:hypothetical protein
MRLLANTAADLAPTVIVMAAVLLIGAPEARADVYKSVDEQGHVVYSDRAITPASRKTSVDVQEADPQEAARLAKQQQMLKAVDDQRQQQESNAERVKLQTQQKQLEKKVRCDSARNRYLSLKDANVIYHRDADGNKVFLPDTEADAKREEARKAMEAACAP